ncbi:MAG: hypothetical protein B6U78_01855 [Candidatus Aenigmarchaeota archaeon ex4484_224]|nr:MAG: hypothetical protein B6U78_01855 [Candidatus Aenigmarchaeota archaeon ex4484_224]
MNGLFFFLSFLDVLSGLFLFFKVFVFISFLVGMLEIGKGIYSLFFAILTRDYILVFMSLADFLCGLFLALSLSLGLITNLISILVLLKGIYSLIFSF